LGVHQASKGCFLNSAAPNPARASPSRESFNWGDWGWLQAVKGPCAYHYQLSTYHRTWVLWIYIYNWWKAWMWFAGTTQYPSVAGAKAKADDYWFNT
jgi:hypothetical protein